MKLKFANSILSLRIILIFSCLWLCNSIAFSQCISTFPYNENFESNSGNWNTGGISSDWVWGTPAKPTINTAGTGAKCWITGGLNASFYNLGERSWVQSPCFDFSAMLNPHIRFKIFWETERTYDGGNLQYSINNGSSWNNVGAAGDATDCRNENWFNSSAILNIASISPVNQGWSGTILPASAGCSVGQGSGGWLIAQHTMTYLAGQSNVIFRFTFGAGTQCNNYDGLAFDDITIEDVPFPINISHVLQPTGCTANTGSAVLTVTGGSPPYIYTWSPAVSVGASATNLSAGNYAVTVTDASGCTNTDAFTIQLPAGVTFSTSSTLDSCSSGKGTATVVVNSGSPPFTYNWSPNVSNSATAINLAAGIYTVTVTDVGGCTSVSSFNIQSSPPVTFTTSTVTDNCAVRQGSASVTVNSGTAPYSYLWSSGNTTIAANNLPSGNYSVTITDALGCTKNMGVFVQQTPPVNFNIVTTPDTCSGNKGTATVILTSGTAPYSYLWNPAVSVANTAANLGVGNYAVKVSDVNGCTKSNPFAIQQPPIGTLQILTAPDTCSGGNGIALASVINGSGPFTYQWMPTGAVTPQINNLTAGTYSLTATDGVGCEIKSEVNIGNINNLVFSLGEDISVCGAINLTLNPGSFASYMWQDSTTSSSYFVNSTGTFYVTVTNAQGCIAADTIDVFEDCLNDVIVPTSFTPNGDKKNEIFYAYGVRVVSFNMKIMDRFGSVVFESNSLDKGWNGFFKGSPAQQGMYVCVLRYSMDGKTEREKFEKILLVR